MKISTISTSIAVALLVGGLSFNAYAQAQTAQPPAAQVVQAERPHDGEWRERGHRHGPRSARERQARLQMAAARHPELAVILDVRALERTYRADGRDKELPALYRDVLNRTQNATVRRILSQRLARIEFHQGDHKAAVDTLKRSLDDDIKRLQ